MRARYPGGGGGEGQGAAAFARGIADRAVAEDVVLVVFIHLLLAHPHGVGGDGGILPECRNGHVAGNIYLFGRITLIPLVKNLVFRRGKGARGQRKFFTRIDSLREGRSATFAGFKGYGMGSHSRVAPCYSKFIAIYWFPIVIS